MNSIKRISLASFFAMMLLYAKGDILLYPHPDLHLYFTIDTSTKEATIGNSIYQENEDQCNAIYYPPTGDPWWNEEPKTNYWKNLDIPSTITCEGKAYLLKTYFDSEGYYRTYWSDVDINTDNYTVTAVAPKAFYKSTRLQSIQTVKLPETIREIGRYAFSWCIYLRSVNIPNQVTSIKEGAFWYCKNMQKFVMPESIETIEASAFSDCGGLQEINIPSNCTSIGNDAFMGCSALHKIIIEDGTEALNVGSSFGVSLLYESVDEDKLDLRDHQRGLFGDCAIDTLYLGRNIVYPYGYDWKSTTSSQWTNRMRPFPPFEKCSKYQAGVKNYYYSGYTLSSLQFGETLTDIPDSLFAVTTITCQISLPSNLQRIGKRAFYWDAIHYIQPRKLEIPQSVEYIGEEAFCLNRFEELILHEGLKTIESRAFYDNIISSLTIPSTITYFGSDAFKSNNITSLLLTEGLKTMPSISDAKIIELTIPESMESIGGNYGTSLRFVHSKPTTPPEGNVSNNPIVYVPAGTGMAYREQGWTNVVDSSDEIITINVKKAGALYSRILNQAECQLADVYRLKLEGTLNDDDWSTINGMNHLYDLDLSEMNIEELPSGFFQNNKKLNKIIFPNTLRAIEDEAFIGCDNIQADIIIPASCSTVGNRAFYNLYFDRVVFNGSTNVQEDAFRDCSLLQEVTLASEMKIGANAFLSTTLKELSIPANVSIGDNAFNITTLKEVTFNGGGQEIGDDVFNGSVEKFTFNGALKAIGSFATSVENIDVDNIGTWCKLPFKNAVSVNLFTINGEEANNIVIPENIKTLREFLFYECPTIQSVVLADDITEISNQAFKGCINLSTISLSANLETIGSLAFSGCTSLQEVILPSKVENLGSSSFDGCTNLSQVVMPSSLTTIDDFAFRGCASLNNVELPQNLSVVGSSAFSGCSSLEKLDLPISITSIGEYVFTNCTSLSLIVAHWKEPITVTNIQPGNNCFLYVPIGLAQKYKNAGWNFSNLMERGLLTVIAIGNGNVKYESDIVNNKKQDFYFKPYSDLMLNLVPNSGYKIMRATLNDENIIPYLSDGEYEIEEPEDDLKLIVIFDDASIEQGDVNGDRVLNDTDAIGIANYVLKRAPEQFHDYWADVNGDGVIDITDIIILISKYTSGQ